MNLLGEICGCLESIVKIMIARNNNSATYPGGVQGSSAANGAAPAGNANDATDLSPLSTGNGPLTKAWYPPIYGATEQQANQIWNDMSSMPLQDREAVGSIHVDSGLKSSTFENVGGTFENSWGMGNGEYRTYGDVLLNPQDLQDPARGKYVVLHESGHAVAIHNGVLDRDSGVTKDIWNDTNNPDVYGDPNQIHEGLVPNPPAEKFADAYAAYYGGDKPALFNASPQEYNAIDSGNFRNPNYILTSQNNVPGAETNHWEIMTGLATQLGEELAQNPSVAPGFFQALGNVLGETYNSPLLSLLGTAAGEMVKIDPYYSMEFMGAWINAMGDRAGGGDGGTGAKRQG